MSKFHVVFGAAGGAGGALVRALAARGDRVRAVTRSGRADAPRDVEKVCADAGDAQSARSACQDAAVIYHCVNVPYARWEAALPGVMDALIAAAGAVEAPLVYCDNLYMYGPPREDMRETTPAAATGRKGRLRARLGDRLLAAHRTGQVRATIGRASDFFGPGAKNTVAGQLVFPAALAGKRAHWIGSLDALHTLSYIDDVARGLAALGGDARALGEVWHLPAAPPVTAREFITKVFEVAGRPPRVGVYPRWMMRLAGIADRQMREALEILYQFESRFVLNSEKFTRTFPHVGVTDLRDAIAQTLEWERTHGTSGMLPIR